MGNVVFGEVARVREQLVEQPSEVGGKLVEHAGQCRSVRGLVGQLRGDDI